MIGIILWTFLTSHIAVCVTSIYIHRGLCHKHYTPTSFLEHIFRFLLWLTDGVITKPWVAQHRKHHRYTDVQGDPTSPKLFGFWHVTKACLIPNFVSPYKYYLSDWAMENYGGGTPNDWLEKNIYCHVRIGVLLLLIIDVMLFGWLGIASWVIHLFLVALLINVTITTFGHTFGYRNYESIDSTTNIFPLGVLSCGEELHHNHHKYPGNPNNAHKWFEFDLGWFYIRILAKLRLLTINKSI
jgi:stearoyl-CoA desaturase (delta-9 desaturase)